MSPENIHYRPLSTETREIRLALLKPDFVTIGTDHEVPVLSLIHRATTTDWPAYCALSYTWGDIGDIAVAVIDDRIVRVAWNLRRFLDRAVRDLADSGNLEADDRHWIERDVENYRDIVGQSSRHAVYWIDAICIDQANDFEKSSQVRFMSHIFSNAAKVVAWIGVHYDHSDIAFDFLNSAASMSDRHDETNANYLLPVLKAAKRESVTVARLARALQSTHFIQAMQSLSVRPYWTRAWVFQEIALSPIFDTQILCGPSTLQMADFRKACRWAMIQDASFWDFRVAGASDTMLEIQDAIRLLQVLPSRAFPENADFQFTLAEHLLEAYLHGGHHATLPHDHVYSFLGISSDSSTCGITSNYSSSVAECFTSTAEYFLRQAGAHTLLMCEVRQNNVHQLPSWVPDWSTQQVSSAITPVVATGAATNLDALFQCSGTHQKLTYRIMASTLFVSTIRLDKVAYALDTPISAYPDLWDPISIQGLLAPHLLGRIQQRYGDDLQAVMLCTTVADQLLSADVGHKRFSKVISALHVGLQEEAAHPASLVELVEHHRTSRELFADGRQLFVTESGYLGYGPVCIVEGDIAHIIRGLDVPVVLRATGQSGFHLLGAAYIHGIMDGEAVADACNWAEMGLQ